MTFKAIIGTAIVCLTLVGCVGPSTKLGIRDVSSTPGAVVRSAWSIKTSDTVPSGVTIIGTADGTSCKNKIWDPAPTTEKALEQLQLKALEAGATGIASVTYTDGGAGALASNCWSLITASGTLYR